MRFAVTQEQMRQIDRYMIQKMKIPGIVLMENAARAVVDFIMQKFHSGTVAVFCGCGNNGGDGFAVARGLLANGFEVSVILVGDELTIGGDARVNYEIIKTLGENMYQVRKREELELAAEETGDADIVVDALFGTGITRNLNGIQKDAVDAINKMRAYKVSVDIPSGISGDTGAVMGAAVRADATMTFQYPKIGHFLYPGKEYTGELKTVRIGIDDGCPVLKELDVRVIDATGSGIGLPKRSANTNKGDYGRLLIIAGSVGMAGAAVLAARAAVRTGAGLTTLASVEYVVNVVQNNVPEAVCITLPSENGSISRNAAFEADSLVKNKTAMAMGPGLSDNQEIQEFVNHMVVNHPITKVFDADALNAIARNTDILMDKTGEVILTPHPREFSRLSGMSVEQVLADPVGAARSFTERFDVTLVLKGAVTVVAKRDMGVTLISVGSPGMAKGGSGDVLTGVIASLAAQGIGVYESAVLGVLINGTAGKMAADEKGEYSMTPGDTIGMIGKAIAGLKNDETLSPIRPAAQKASGTEKYWPTETEPEEEEYIGEETAQDEPASLGAMGLEEHFNFLSPEEELKQKAPNVYQSSTVEFADRVDARRDMESKKNPLDMRRRIVPKPFHDK